MATIVQCEIYRVSALELLALILCTLVLSCRANTGSNVYPKMYENVSHIYWIHLPKSGGTALARVAITTARDRKKTFAFCYQARGEPDCSQPALWTKQKAIQAGQIEFYPQKEEAQEDLSANPYIVFGHYTKSASAEWKLQGAAVHVIMIRHPIDRFFSGYMQNQRAANNRKQALQDGKRIAAEDPGAEGGFNMEIFADSCVASGNRMMMVGPLLEYLGVDNLSDVSDTRALVTAAKHVVDDPAVLVLVYEWYAESLKLLEKLGVTTQASAKIFNATPRSESVRLKHKDLANIRRCVLPEEEVYVYAVDVFRAKYERVMGERLDAFPIQ